MAANIECVEQQELAENEIINRLSLKISHLFSIKEKQRVVIGEFLNSEVINVNAPSQSVKRYDLTFQLDLLGAIRGKILLNVETRLAARIAAGLFGSVGVSEDEMHTAMQELLNIFAGHLVTALNETGFDADIGTPSLTDEDFLANREGRRILFRFLSINRVLQFILILKS